MANSVHGFDGLAATRLPVRWAGRVSRSGELAGVDVGRKGPVPLEEGKQALECSQMVLKIDVGRDMRSVL